MFAASAIAANTIMRSVFGAVFPLWASYMYEGMLALFIFKTQPLSSADALVTIPQF